MHYLSQFIRLFSIIILLTSYSNSLATTTFDPVESAIKALKNGQFQTALELLKSPRGNVSSHPDRQNALGLSYYYLQQYTKAKKHFKLAQKTPRRHEAAFYLGEITSMQGQSKIAKQWYTKAANQYEDLEVQAQAENALLRLTLNKNKKNTNSTANNSLQHYLYIALDKNAIDGIIDPDDDSGSDQKDTSTTFLVAGKTTLLTFNDSVDWKLGAHYYEEKYDEVVVNNLDELKLFSTLEWVENGQWVELTELKLAHSSQTLNAQDYLDQTEIAFKNTWKDNKQFILFGRIIDVSSPNGNYAHYNGITTELGSEIRGGDTTKWLLSIKWRNEDRQGLSSIVTNDDDDNFDSFTAYAREMFTYKAQVSWPLSKQWQSKLEASIRDAKYQDDDLYLAYDDDIELSSQTRSTVRTTLKAELINHITNELDLNIRYEHNDEDSNDNNYDYTNQKLSIGMSYFF